MVVRARVAWLTFTSPKYWSNIHTFLCISNQCPDTNYAYLHAVITTAFPSSQLPYSSSCRISLGTNIKWLSFLWQSKMDCIPHTISTPRLTSFGSVAIGFLSLCTITTLPNLLACLRLVTKCCTTLWMQGDQDCQGSPGGQTPQGSPMDQPLFPRVRVRV